MRTSEIRLICGLGNPPEVAPAESLHNVGFMALDLYALNELTTPEWRNVEGGLACTIGEPGNSIELFKPLHEDINHSGIPLNKVLTELEVHPRNVVIVHDDIDLAAGKIKIKEGPSNDRHNGLRSIAEELGTTDFIRLKGGVGRPHDKSQSVLSWVKDQMPPEMKPVVASLVERLAKTIADIKNFGLAAARNKIGS
jgi:peptidyl-tRNA hydrolase, PTH1 family